jgi:HSP20 family molecular chaperone IbpA
LFQISIFAVKIEFEMSLITKIGNGFFFTSISDPSGRNGRGCRGLNNIPQEVLDCAPQAEIDISEDLHHYIVSSKLPGVARRNLWVYIEGRTLFLYATVTGERQENGEYRYTEELLGGIRGEIVLPEQAFRGLERAEFNDGVLLLVFPKITDELLEQLIPRYRA